MSINCDSNIKDKIGDFTLSEERLRVFTGLGWPYLVSPMFLISPLAISRKESTKIYRLCTELVPKHM